MKKTFYTVKVITFFMNGAVREFENPTEYATRKEANVVIESQKRSIERNGLIERVEGMEYEVVATQYNINVHGERELLDVHRFPSYRYHKKGGNQ